ncbi:hypothetical protein [Winogradskyella sp. SYSU M77433]|uniref:hypothetical protein n=1 Tax=Winogradskyella sp. SYSU M77433 TaxID=3042722 RepID=UPI0024810CFB|nr:hypothetical protein [Winogradskyella sp. SYSU M77433]MDH7911851.1 hypothetical protein [Winogradskyella sp. SYSU M77433]
MIRKITLLILLIFISCEKKLNNNEINNFCFKFVYSIHSKNEYSLRSLINEKKLVENTNNKLKDKNFTVDSGDIITGLFINYNPLKYGRGYNEKLNDFNTDDLEIIILENISNIKRLNIKWNNIFSCVEESIIITVENKKITLIE